MFFILQVLTVLLASIGMAMALAHALELPGKLRLDKETYLAIQPINYPGFTVARGIGKDCHCVKFVWDGNGTNFAIAGAKAAINSYGKRWLLLTNDYVVACLLCSTYAALVCQRRGLYVEFL